MHSNCIKNLLNLKEVIVKSIKNFENLVEIYAELPISKQLCPCCVFSISSYILYLILKCQYPYIFLFLVFNYSNIFKII